MKKGIIDSNRKFQTSVKEFEEGINLSKAYFNIHPLHVKVIREKISEMLKTWADGILHEDAWKVIAMAAFLNETDHFYEIEEDENC